MSKRVENNGVTVVGLLWSWWLGDDLAKATSLYGLEVLPTEDSHKLARTFGYSVAAVEARFRSDQTVYVASLKGTWLACGWVAAGSTSFGVPEVPFSVPFGHRYLLDFVTLPRWRGKGVYPFLLQAIVARERSKAGRFWIIHEASNHASARGIEKAGFKCVAEVCLLRSGLNLKPVDTLRTKVAAEVFGLQVL